jgi:hypothetical protein
VSGNSNWKAGAPTSAKRNSPGRGRISHFLGPHLIIIVIFIEKKGRQDEQDLQDKGTNQAIAALSFLHPVHPVHPVIIAFNPSCV